LKNQLSKSFLKTKKMDIKERYLQVLKLKEEATVRSGRSGEEIILIGVTKTHPAEEINQAIDAGITDIGENRAQELLEKYNDVKPVRWHFIGKLQTNKVKSIIDKVEMIHSVDSIRLAREIDKRAKMAGKRMDILIQVNSAMEDTKTGIHPKELKSMVADIIDECDNVRICGLMCIPPIAENPEDSRPYFKEMKTLLENMKMWDFPRSKLSPTHISMGMSGDFQVAIEEGSTMIRVGSSIFGPRNYK